MASNISIEGNKKKIQNIAIQTKKDSNFSFYNVSPISVNERKKNYKTGRFKLMKMIENKSYKGQFKLMKMIENKNYKGQFKLMKMIENKSFKTWKFKLKKNYKTWQFKLKKT